MATPCYTCKKESRACHIDLRYDACFECRCRDVECWFATEPGVKLGLEIKAVQAEGQTQDAQKERRRLWELLPKDFIKQLDDAIPTLTEEEATDLARHAPDQLSAMFTRADEMTESEDYKAIEQFLAASGRCRRMRLQEDLAYQRYERVAYIGEDVKEELKKVEDDMREVLGDEGFEKWMMSDDITRYWDPSVKQLVSVSSENT